MNDTNPVKLYETPQHRYTLVWFEDLNQWHIRKDYLDATNLPEWWSQEGWDSKHAAQLAWDNTRITYVETVPGQS